MKIKQLLWNKFGFWFPKWPKKSEKNLIHYRLIAVLNKTWQSCGHCNFISKSNNFIVYIRSSQPGVHVPLRVHLPIWSDTIKVSNKYIYILFVFKYLCIYQWILFSKIIICLSLNILTWRHKNGAYLVLKIWKSIKNIKIYSWFPRGVESTKFQNWFSRPWKVLNLKMFFKTLKSIEIGQNMH